MIRLIRSHDLDHLADVLAETLREPPRDPLVADWVVASGRAAERWAVPQLAQRLGIAAHVQVLSASTLLETVVAAAGGRPLAELRRWRGERLLWPVLRTLPTLLHDGAFRPVRDYLAHGGDAPVLGDARAVTFARGLADVLARYQASVPDLVRRWDAGEDVVGPQGLRWQAALHRTIRTELGSASLVGMADEAFARLRSDGRPPRVPDRLVWLVQGRLLALHRELLTALAAGGVSVTVLLATPMADPVTEDPDDPEHAPAHPLLASLGRLPRRAEFELRTVLGDAGVAVAEEPLDGFMRPDAAAKALLGRLQDALLSDTLPAQRATGADDASLQVHCCHGRMRQVEVLRDELLRAFDEIPGLTPRDVIVITPDVEAFAPLVDAAFAPAAGVPAIPVRVADRVVVRDRVADDIALRLLALAAGRVDVASVLDLIALPPVSERLGLTADDHPRLREWVVATSIRWGIDGNDRTACAEVPYWREHSWEFGVDRLVLGAALPNDDAALFGDVLPFDDVEGDGAELAGRLAEAWTRVARAVQALRAPRPLGEWVEALRDGVESLLDLEVPASAAAAYGLATALATLLEEAGDAAARPLSLDALRALLTARLGETSLSGGFGAGAVSVGRLQPGRVVPARVVALLGMDEDVFPRRAGRSGLDLLDRDPELIKTVRASPADEDRALFLDAILAARDRLIVTYAGRQVDTNAERPPAVPVAELLGTVAAMTGATPPLEPGDSGLHRRHAMQPFSPACFAAAAPLAHDPLWLAGARALLGPRRPAPAFLQERSSVEAGARSVTLDQLERFLCDPAGAFLRDVLDVTFEELRPLEEREPAGLDALARHRVRDRLLSAVRTAPHAADAVLHARIAAEGLLPPLGLGETAFEQARREALAVAARAATHEEGRYEERLELDDVFGGWRVTGSVGPLWDDVQVVVQAGKLTAKARLRAWVRHLALCHLRPGGRTVLVCHDTTASGTRSQRLNPVSDAAERLAELVALRERGVREPLPFLPDTSWAYAEAVVAKQRSPVRGMQDAAEAYLPDFGDGGDGNRPAVRRVFGDGTALFGEDPCDGDFAQVSRTVWEPVFSHAEKTET